MMIDNNELTWQATAAANILEARLRKGRLATRKSRAGCKTCKVRRVKCDQTRPICQRCVNSGRECEGYIDLPSPELKKTSNSLVGLRLSQSIGLEDGDRRVFDYFLSWTAPRLAGSLDKDFWCGHVLQIAQAEPVVRDALLSISLLYEHPQFLVSFHNRTTASAHEDLAPGSWLQSDRRSISSSDSSSSDVQPTVTKPKIDKFHALALKYYNRSIYAFNERMSAGEATPLLALLSCVLYICIETMRDNAFSALALFKQGAKLMRQLGFEELGHKGGILFSLRQRFSRIRLLAALSGHPEQLGDEPEAADGGVRCFSTLSEARDILFEVMYASHLFITEAEYRADLQAKVTETGSPNDANAWSFSTEMTQGKLSVPVASNEEPDDGVTRLFYRCQDATSPASPLPVEAVHPTFLPRVLSPELVAKQKMHLDRLRLWYDEFMRLDEKSTDAGCSLLIHYYAYYIMLSARLDPFETVFDQYRDEFEQILLLAEKYMDYKPERQTYTTETQVVAPLYFMATKCRIPSFRRRAIDLVKRAPMKECTFGASSTSEVASRMIAIEEQGLFPPDGAVLSRSFDDSILPPDSARIRGFEIIVNRPLGIHELRVTRYSCRDDGCWIKSIADFPL